jgi:hypothetical protein
MSPHCSRKRMRSELQRWRALMITKVHLADIWLMRPDGIGHPLAASTAPLGARGEWHGFFRAGSGLFQDVLGSTVFRVGFRVGLTFLQGFLMVCFRGYLGLT